MSNYWGIWFCDWIATPQPWAYLLLWCIWFGYGLWDMIRGLEIPDQKKAWDGVDKLVKGLGAFFMLHVVMLMDWEDGLAAFGTGVGISILQVIIASPLILGVLQNMGVLPKPEKKAVAAPAQSTGVETQKP